MFFKNKRVFQRIKFEKCGRCGAKIQDLQYEPNAITVFHPVFFTPADTFQLCEKCMKEFKKFMYG